MFLLYADFSKEGDCSSCSIKISLVLIRVDTYNSERVLQLLPVLTRGFENSSATMGTRWLHSQAHPVQYKRELTTE